MEQNEKQQQQQKAKRKKQQKNAHNFMRKTIYCLANVGGFAFDAIWYSGGIKQTGHVCHLTCWPGIRWPARNSIQSLKILDAFQKEICIHQCLTVAERSNAPPIQSQQTSTPTWIF